MSLKTDCNKLLDNEGTKFDMAEESLESYFEKVLNRKILKDEDVQQ